MQKINVGLNDDGSELKVYAYKL